MCVYNQTFVPIWSSVLLGVPLPAQLRFADSEVGTPSRLVPQVTVQATWGTYPNINCLIFYLQFYFIITLTEH